MVLAGVDIGTLTCRLLIAEITTEGKLVEQQSDRRILRLGEGVDGTKSLGAAAMDRVCAALREWRAIIGTTRVDAETAVATSAVREAKNRALFLARAYEEAGFAVEVISGEEEARRTLLGIRAGLPANLSGFVALDIGGGSTEIIVERPSYPPMVRSIDIGVVRVTERYLHHDPPTEAEIRAAREAVTVAMEEARAALGPTEDLTLLGTAGSITTLAAMAQQLPTYESARIHNYRLELNTICHLETEILRRTKKQRQGMLGLETGREQVITAGALILRQAVEVLGHATCLVSDYGLREGVLIDLAQRRGASKQSTVTL